MNGYTSLVRRRNHRRHMQNPSSSGSATSAYPLTLRMLSSSFRRTSLLSDAPPMMNKSEPERNWRVHWSSLVRHRRPLRQQTPRARICQCPELDQTLNQLVRKKRDDGRIIRSLQRQGQPGSPIRTRCASRRRYGNRSGSRLRSKPTRASTGPR